MTNIIDVHNNLTLNPKDKEDLLNLANRYEIQELHVNLNPETQLQAIIAIHSTKLGPAFGGCRCISYKSIHEAFFDGIRLAQGMSYKAAIMGLPYGGGKAVLIKPSFITDRVAYFKSFGNFIEKLGGQYITAVDVGTTVKDMDIIATQTKYVSSTSRSKGGRGDPALYTARGVLKGMQAAIYHKFRQTDLSKMRIAIQGVGNVGYCLAKQLVKRGAEIFICDVNQDIIKKCVREFKCKVLSPKEIYTAGYDIYAPCALGGTINERTIRQLRCSIVAGSANNQLAQAQTKSFRPSTN